MLPVKSAPSAAPQAPPALVVPRLQLVLGALLFSTGGAAIKACAFSGPSLTGLRSGIAALTILVIVPSSRTIGTPRTWLVGLAYAVTMFTFVEANKLTTSANAIFLQYTSPLYILLLGPLVLGERVRRGDLAYTAVIFSGLCLFFVGSETAGQTAPHPVLGNLLGALSGATWATTLIGIRWLAKNEGATGSAGTPGAAMLSGNLLTFLFTLPWTLSISGGRLQDWLIIGYLGVFQLAVAYFCVTAGLRRLPALEASLILIVEPIFNPVWAFIVQGERPGAWALIGGAIILLSSVLKTVSETRRWRRGG
jgi:drug/metabolite transporter, DME family